MVIWQGLSHYYENNYYQKGVKLQSKIYVKVNGIQVFNFLQTAVLRGNEFNYYQHHDTVYSVRLYTTEYLPKRIPLEINNLNQYYVKVCIPGILFVKFSAQEWK